jgi:hypothetical protein
VKATDISSEKLAGALLFNRALLFARDKDVLNESFTVELPKTCDKVDVLVAGVAHGKWKISDRIVEVKDEEGILSFTATESCTVITPINAN